MLMLYDRSAIYILPDIHEIVTCATVFWGGVVIIIIIDVILAVGVVDDVVVGVDVVSIVVIIAGVRI